MTPAALAVIGATIIFSSFVSGIFGMAGGMILLGVLLNYFDVATGMILFSIGLMPFLIEALPPTLRPNIERRGVPFVTGLVTTVVQILSGVGGLFLDIFFQKSKLDRKTTNATKAVAQSFSHIVRALYFGSLSGIGDLPLRAIGPAIVLAIAGTSLAPFVIERMTDHGYRQWTRAIIFAISIVYLIHAGWLFWRG